MSSLRRLPGPRGLAVAPRPATTAGAVGRPAAGPAPCRGGTWTLTPGGEGDRTLVRLAAELRDPHVSGWLARVWARRALRRLCGLLLGHLDADLGGARSPGGDRWAAVIATETSRVESP